MEPETFPDAYLPEPIKLTWQTTPSITIAIDDAMVKAKEACVGYNANAITFKECGTKYMKEIAETNPDTYFQLVLQLAWAKVHGIEDKKPVYESASTRRFNCGRTETIRSLTTESAALANVFKCKETLVSLSDS